MNQIRSDGPSGLVPGISIRWLFGSPTVRIQRWACEVSTRHVTSDRSQPWHVVGFVHSGAYEMRDRRGTSLHDPTRVSFFNAGATYQTSHPAGLGDRGSSLLIEPQALREMIALYDPSVEEHPEVPFHFAQAPISGAALLRYRILLRESESPARVDPMELEEESLALTHTIIRQVYGAGRAADSPLCLVAIRRRVVEAARAFLIAGFSRVCRLTDVARAAGVSSFHLCRIFKSEVGCTVHAYLNSLRLRAALDQLPDRKGDLSALASDVGYSSHSHFTRAFRREFGVSPSSL